MVLRVKLVAIHHSSVLFVVTAHHFLASVKLDPCDSKCVSGLIPYLKEDLMLLACDLTCYSITNGGYMLLLWMWVLQRC